MRSLKLDDTGDLVMENNELVFINGVDEIKQCLRQILRTNTNEWFLDPTLGFDRYTVLGQKTFNEEDVREALVNAIEQEPRIETVENIEINFDDRKRELHIRFVAIADGEEIEFEEVI